MQGRPLSPAPAPSSGEPLSLAHARRVAPLLAKCVAGQGEQAIADLSFANLWLFRRAHGYRFIEGDWPVIRGHAYDGQHHVLPLFALADAPSPVLRDLLHPGECFFPIATGQAQTLDRTRFTLDSARDDADYLYRADAFRTYAGAGLHNKRNLLKQCLTAHRLTHATYTPALREAALHILRMWMQEKGKQVGDADDLPTQEALLDAPSLGLQGFVTWADGEPAGFVLAEELQPGVCVVRFAKGLTHIKGIAQAMFQHLASEADALFGRAPQWLNFEQDLGLPNFRRTKLSYQPHALLAKYRVWLK